MLNRSWFPGCPPLCLPVPNMQQEKIIPDPTILPYPANTPFNGLGLPACLPGGPHSEPSSPGTREYTQSATTGTQPYHYLGRQILGFTPTSQRRLREGHHMPKVLEHCPVLCRVGLSPLSPASPCTGYRDRLGVPWEEARLKVGLREAAKISGILPREEQLWGPVTVQSLQGPVTVSSFQAAPSRLGEGGEGRSQEDTFSLA